MREEKRSYVQYQSTGVRRRFYDVRGYINTRIVDGKLVGTPIARLTSTEKQRLLDTMNGIDERSAFESAAYLPKSITLNDQGVSFETKDKTREWIITTPLWLVGMVQSGETRQTHLKLEWCGYGDKVESTTMPASYLGDNRKLAWFLYDNNIAGFSARQVGNVAEYLRGSVLEFNKRRETDIGFSRNGWTLDGFVIGSELVKRDGIVPAEVVRVPGDMKSALVARGDLKKWAQVTTSLVDDDEWSEPKDYWSFRFTLQAMLAAPLLKLLNADSAVLSLAGDSGAGKTTIAEFGLSAYGKPKALEIAPQSTERAFYEFWRLANNLPVLCNEAATIDPKRINSIVYAAANGESRNTLTQTVQLRDTSNWTTLTVFTSNNHLQGLDQTLLNEAGRRRIFEITIDHPLDGEIARDLNEIMRDNYGLAGREFLSYVVANEAAVKERLKSSHAWVIENGVQDAERFAAWTIATAKVAGEIAADLGIFYFEPISACLRAIEAVTKQARQTKTPLDRVDDLITDFISAHHDRFSQFQPRGSVWIDAGARGEIVGRFSVEGAQTVLAISRKAFTSWARTQGVDSQHITQYVRQNGVEEKNAKLIPHGKSTWCLILTIQNDAKPSHPKPSRRNKTWRKAK